MAQYFLARHVISHTAAYADGANGSKVMDGFAVLLAAITRLNFINDHCAAHTSSQALLTEVFQ